MKVSAYCLVYNHEKYLRDALEGFVSQKTDFDYEVFVHDDASTDSSAAIIREYAEKYPEIIKPIFQTENQYSKGIKIPATYIWPRMTGEYIAVCEGDDYWCDPTKLQRQVDFLDAHPGYVACVHNTKKVHLLKHEECNMYSHPEDEDITFMDVIQNGSAAFHISSVVYRREYAFNRPDFFKAAKRFGDYPLRIYLALSGKIRFINRVMSVYRQGTESSFTLANTRDPKKNALVFKSCADLLREVDAYTRGQYAEVLGELILKNEYLYHFNLGEYSVLRREPYRKLYKSNGMGYRLKTYAKQYLKWPYQLYRKIKYGSNRKK